MAVLQPLNPVTGLPKTPSDPGRHCFTVNSVGNQEISTRTASREADETRLCFISPSLALRFISLPNFSHRIHVQARFCLVHVQSMSNNLSSLLSRPIRAFTRIFVASTFRSKLSDTVSLHHRLLKRIN